MLVLHWQCVRVLFDSMDRAERDLRGTEAYLAQLKQQHETDSKAVEDAVKHLQQLQQSEAEKGEALSAYQAAKNDGLEKLNTLLLKSESDLREQWVTILQLENDEHSMRILRRRVDLLLLEEKDSRTSLQKQLGVASTALHDFLGTLEHVDDSDLAKLARRLGLQGAPLVAPGEMMRDRQEC